MKTYALVLATALLFGASLPPARADTEFDYVGNNFSYCFDGTAVDSSFDCTNGRVTGHFVTTLSGDALDNLSDVFIADTFLSIDMVPEFSFSDGLGLELTKANTDSTGFEIWTDAAGNLTRWVVIVQQVFGSAGYQNDIEILGAPARGNGVDLSHHCTVYGPLCSGDNELVESTPQGVWSSHAVSTPEPETLSLFGAGLLMSGLVAGRFTRSRKAAAL